MHETYSCNPFFNTHITDVEIHRFPLMDRETKEHIVFMCSGNEHTLTECNTTVTNISCDSVGQVICHGL